VAAESIPFLLETKNPTPGVFSRRRAFLFHAPFQPEAQSLQYSFYVTPTSSPMARRAIRPVGVSGRFHAGGSAGVLGFLGDEADEVSAFLLHVHPKLLWRSCPIDTQ